MANHATGPPLHIRAGEHGDVRGADRAYERAFSVGREASCDVHVQAPMVSRVHVRLEFENGRWWVCDQGSTNGTYLDGERVDRELILGEATLQLGHNGPIFQLSQGASRAKHKSASVTPAANQNTWADETTPNRDFASAQSVDRETSEPAPASSDPSVSRYIERYFDEDHADDDTSAGEHTRMLRQAYQRVQARQRRKYTWFLAGMAVLFIAAVGYGYWQYGLNVQFEQSFSRLKTVEVEIAQLEREQGNSAGSAELSKELARLQQERQRLERRYESYAQSLREAHTAVEREIYRTAYLFRESEADIPPAFVDSVRAIINDYWLREPHRSDLVQAVQRAERNGYTSHIAETLVAYGLPPEFFYLALQESKFKTNAVGPETSWGRAKGMWQFIPRTARKFDLDVGLRPNADGCPVEDGRCRFETSTEAAARYLKYIYSTKAQASGLLVIASYNWGEHRVVSKLERLPGPQRIPEEVIEDIPETPDDRNYWRFLTEYDDRMPEETKDYVLKVFSAAVIGQNPRLFGIDLENPLREHMQQPAAVSALR